MLRIGKLVLVGALAAFVTPASATLIVTNGNTSGGTNVVSVKGCGPTGAPNTTIMGCLQNNKSLDVIFQSTANTTQENMAFAAGGQAKLIAPQGVDPNESSTDYGYNNFKLSLGGGLVFNTVIMNIEVFDATDIHFLDNYGQLSGAFHLVGNGNGFFTISDSAGPMSWLEVMSGDRTIHIDVGHGPHAQSYDITDGDINDVKQVRLKGITNPNGPPPPIPEPASIAVLGAGLVGAGFIGRRKKRTDKKD